MPAIRFQPSVKEGIVAVSPEHPFPVQTMNQPKKRVNYAFKGAAAISKTTSAAKDFIGKSYELVQVDAKFSSAPTTSENFTVTLDSGRGSTFDTVLYSVNPATSALTSVVNIWDPPYELEPGDEVVIAFTNTDTRTVGGRVLIREVA